MTYALASNPGLAALYSPFGPQVNEVVQAPAGWHGGGDIQTLVGLPGTYLWSESALSTGQITFAFNQNSTTEGVYLLRTLSGVEQGRFIAQPNNPAVGFAFIGLLPDNQSAPRTFVIQGMMTDSNWKIIILVLNRLDDRGIPLPPMFSAVRIV